MKRAHPKRSINKIRNLKGQMFCNLFVFRMKFIVANFDLHEFHS